MISRLKFHPTALKNWQKLDHKIRRKFLSKLKERMVASEVLKDRLRDELSSCFKIRLISDGYRLVYEPKYEDNVLYIRGVGRRDEAVYSQAVKSFIDS